MATQGYCNLDRIVLLLLERALQLQLQGWKVGVVFPKVEDFGSGCNPWVGWKSWVWIIMEIEIEKSKVGESRIAVHPYFCRLTIKTVSIQFLH